MEIKKRPATNVRAFVFMFLFLIIFCITIGRIIYIQTGKEIKGVNLQQLAEEKWTVTKVLEGRRGTIFDRDGEPLAQELTSYTMYAILDKNEPSYVKDPSKTAEILSEYLNMSKESLEELLTTPNRFQVELGPSAKNLSHEKMKQIAELNLPGIKFREEPRRYYPNQEFASHVIGYTERDMVEARMGLESSLDKYLRGKDGSIEYKRDINGIKLNQLQEIFQPPEHGKDVYLTLDSNIQIALEQIMTKIEEEYDPEKMIAIVADPKTGQILAMSNRPSFNPNRYEEIENYTNFAIADRYEPGSTMKIFTLAAAIEEGVFNANETFKSGTYQIGPDMISDHNQGLGWGEITFREGLELSSNVAFSILALEKLGKDRLYQYLERFGFTEPTGIDLPGEVNSLIADQYTLDVATTAIGQATAVTPIQQVQAAMAIANGGKLMKPYVIDRIVDSETKEELVKNEPEVKGEILSESTSKQVLQLLEGVVTSEIGTGKPYFIEGFDVVGKTGTAQIPNPNGRGYLRGKNENIFSFIGMAPKDDPQLVVYVAVDRPKLKPFETGSAPVSQIFTTVMKHSLQYLNIDTTSSHENTIEEIGYKVENYKNQPISSVAEKLENEGLIPIIVGDGDKIVSQEPSAGEYVLPNERIMLRTNAKEYTMPNMFGWSFRDMLKLTKVLELKPSIFGTGFVTSQSMQPGSVVRVGDYITVELAHRNEIESKKGDHEEENANEDEEMSES